jgi:hydrogenase-4 component B
MGLMSLTLGLILLEPDLADVGVLALSLYAAHHALAKGGLFLGVGLRHNASAQGLVLAGVTLLALSLAAVPFSGGAVAKHGIKPMLAETDWSWLVTAVAVTTVGTALLMARFVSVIWHIEPHPSPGQALGGAGWVGLLVLILLYPVVLGTLDAWATNALPSLFALLIVLPFALAARRRPDLLRPSADLVPAGDLVGLARYPIGVLGFSGRRLGRWWNRLLRAGSARLNAASLTGDEHGLGTSTGNKARRIGARVDIVSRFRARKAGVRTCCIA